VVTKLVEVKRTDTTDPEAERFNEFNERLRDGENTAEDWDWIRNLCSRNSMGETEWIRRGFAERNVTHIYCTNALVNKKNVEMLKGTGKPIALLKALNSSPEARKLLPDKFQGLENSLYLCVDAYVLITQNIATKFGLCNGATGTVVDIIYLEDSPPNLPFCVVVNVPTYTGPPLFGTENGRKHWVPIFPRTMTCDRVNIQGETETLSRTHFPLKLSWAWTLWKAQGLTIFHKMVLHLTLKEMEHGLAYTGFTRATKPSNIGLYDAFPLSRLTDIKKLKKVKDRIKEEKNLDIMDERTKDLYKSLR
jgi:hypothetical protein